MQNDPGHSPPTPERPFAKYVIYLALYLFLGYVFFSLYNIVTP